VGNDTPDLVTKMNPYDDGPKNGTTLAYARQGFPANGEILTPLEFMDHIFGDLKGYAVVFTGRQARLEDPEARPNSLVRVEQQSYAYRVEAAAASAALSRSSDLGLDAYLSVHLFRVWGSRLAEHAIERVGTLWLDEDEGRYPEDLPRPTLEVRSSAGRRHLYWGLTEPIPAEKAVELNRRIASAAGGDTTKAGLSSVLRPPGTRNYKRFPDVDEVTARLTGVRAWEPEALDAAIPRLPEPEPVEAIYVGPLEEGIDLDAWLASHYRAHLRGGVRDGRGKKYAVVCPWVAQHSGEDPTGTYVGQYAREDGTPNGPTWFRCWHQHCEGRTWRDFRAQVEPPRHRVYARRREVISLG
jgi:hypothetical protein